MSKTELRNSRNCDSSYTYRLSVGMVHPRWENWKPAVARDGAIYHYTVAGHEVTWFLTWPDQSDIETFRHGRIQVDFLAPGRTLALRLRSGTDSLRATASYSNDMVAQERRALPPMPQTETDHARLLVTLVDRATGVVLALRMVSLAPEFTRIAHAAIREAEGSTVASYVQESPLTGSHRKRPQRSAAGSDIARAAGVPWAFTGILRSPWSARTDSGRVAKKATKRRGRRR